jgi:ABC-type multidrug transport system permease subunit
MIGAAFDGFDDASKVSGFLVSALITYTGYMIPKTGMHPWFVWIYWINPLAYGFEALMANGTYFLPLHQLLYQLVKRTRT